MFWISVADVASEGSNVMVFQDANAFIILVDRSTGMNGY